MEKLKVLFASPEVVPFAKTGGLADVAGKLPAVIAEAGHDVRVFMPKYSTISPLLLDRIKSGPSLKIKIGEVTHLSRIMHLPEVSGQPKAFFIDYPDFYDRSDLYVDPETGEDYGDNAERFILFCRAILESIKALDWKPDIIHANDWQAALLPTYLKTAYADESFYSDIRSVFTIHNMGYQGIFPAENFPLLGLPDEFFYAAGPFEFWGKMNLLKSAVWYADTISTVSEKYAEEIQSSAEFGYGLEGVLRTRRNDLYGIVNGVDYRIWSPSRDKLIPYRYNISNLSGKKKSKIELLRRMGLPYREDAMLVGMITRLADQKGLDIFEKAADGILKLNLQMIVLGTGDKKYEALLTRLEKKYARKLKVNLVYDNDLAHWIEAGADAFLMPSRYEPCGLNQLYSLRYGTVPIVRATGGLVDTIDDVDEGSGQGTGFMFIDYDGGALMQAVKRAVKYFRKKRAWRNIMKAGMQKDFSWTSSAEKYISLYHKTPRH